LSSLSCSMYSLSNSLHSLFFSLTG
jgi:hypothetical protein